MPKVKYYAHEVRLFEDLLRRYVCFHEGEDMKNINLWGLAMYGDIRPVREKGYIISSVTKAEKQGWYKPNNLIITTVIYPAYLLYKADTTVQVLDKTQINYSNYINAAIAKDIKPSHVMAWTATEDALLQQYYPIEGPEVHKRLTGRTPAACIMRANMKGLRR